MSSQANLNECTEGDSECNKMNKEIRSKFNGKNDAPLKEIYDIRTTNYYSREIDVEVYKIFKDINNDLRSRFNQGEHLKKYSSIKFIDYGKILNFSNDQSLNLLLGFFQNYKSKIQYFDILIKFKKEFLLNWLDTNYIMLENITYLYSNFFKLVSKYFINMIIFVGKRDNLKNLSFQEKFRFIMDIALNKSNIAQFNEYEYSMVNVAFKCLYNKFLISKFLNLLKTDINSIKNDKNINIIHKNMNDIESYYTECLEKLNLYGTKDESIPYKNYLLYKNPSFDVTFLNIYIDTSMKNIKIYMEDLQPKT